MRSYGILTDFDMIAAFLHAVWLCLSPVTRFMVSSKGKRDLRRTQSRENTGGTSRISTTKVKNRQVAEAWEKSLRPRGGWVARMEGSAQARPGLVKRVENVETGCDMYEIKQVQGMSALMLQNQDPNHLACASWQPIRGRIALETSVLPVISSRPQLLRSR